MPNFIAQRDIVLLTDDGQPDYVERGEIRNFPHGAPVSKNTARPNWVPVDAQPVVAQKMLRYTANRAIELPDGTKASRGDDVYLAAADAAVYVANGSIRNAAAKTGANA